MGRQDPAPVALLPFLFPLAKPCWWHGDTQHRWHLGAMQEQSFWGDFCLFLEFLPLLSDAFLSAGGTAAGDRAPSGRRGGA